MQIHSFDIFHQGFAYVSSGSHVVMEWEYFWGTYPKVAELFRLAHEKTTVSVNEHSYRNSTVKVGRFQMGTD